MTGKLIANKAFIIGTITFLAVFIITGITLGYLLKWEWTGFNQQVLGPSGSQYQPGKTLWDWLQLFIIPAFLVIGGFSLNRIQTGRTEKASRERAIIADNNQYQAIFQAYIDKLSELIIEKKLLDSGRKEKNSQSKEDELEIRRKHELRKVASVQTLTVLSNLDEKRKKSVINFLYNLKLIEKDNCVVELSGADLQNVDLSGTILNDADLSGANLIEANLIGAALNRSDLRGAKLSDANLLRAELRKADLSGADLSGTELIGAYLSDADLHGAYLSDAYLNGADLRGSNLSGADLRDADLSSANLSGANLSDMDLSDIDLSGSKSDRILTLSKKQTNLSGANLSDAKLNDADLRGANLHGADLSGTDLSGANLKDASINIEILKKQARPLQNTIMPDG